MLGDLLRVMQLPTSMWSQLQKVLLSTPHIAFPPPHCLENRRPGPCTSHCDQPLCGPCGGDSPPDAASQGWDLATPLGRRARARTQDFW